MPKLEFDKEKTNRENYNKLSVGQYFVLRDTRNDFTDCLICCGNSMQYDKKIIPNAGYWIMINTNNTEIRLKTFRTYNPRCAVIMRIE